MWVDYNLQSCSQNFCEVGRGDGSVLSVNVRKKSKRFTLTKLGDVMFESGHVFFWKIVSDNGDYNITKFTVGR